jgi:hypothetical protein
MFKQQKKARFEAKAGPGKKSLVSCFLFKETSALKRQLEKTENTPSIKKRRAKLLVSIEI